MWDPASPAKGKISPYDDGIYIADAAVYLMATRPELGIKNPYALDRTQFDAAVDLVRQQKPLVAEYWADVVKQGQGLASGAVTQSQGWQLTANLANGESGTSVGTTKPVEGATGWSDTWMIKKDTAEHQLRVPVAEPRGVAAGQRADRGVLRRGAREPEVVRADRRTRITARCSTPRRPTSGTTSTTGRRRPRTASTAGRTSKCVAVRRLGAHVVGAARLRSGRDRPRAAAGWTDPLRPPGRYRHPEAP